MRTVRLRTRYDTEDAHRDFQRVADFGLFPSLADDVRAVDVDRLRIDFDQTDGDFAEFHGFWQLDPVLGGCEVVFEVTYDFGIESLAGFMDPIAEQVVKRVVCAVLTELFGDVRVLAAGLADQPAFVR